jgi:hypothetical protein
MVGVWNICGGSIFRIVSNQDKTLSLYQPYSLLIMRHMPLLSRSWNKGTREEKLNLNKIMLILSPTARFGVFLRFALAFYYL